MSMGHPFPGTPYKTGLPKISPQNFASHFLDLYLCWVYKAGDKVKRKSDGYPYYFKILLSKLHTPAYIAEMREREYGIYEVLCDTETAERYIKDFDIMGIHKGDCIISVDPEGEICRYEFLDELTYFSDTRRKVLTENV